MRECLENPRTGADTADRRVALARHGKGSVLLYFDTTRIQVVEKITIDDWRDIK